MKHISAYLSMRRIEIKEKRAWLPIITDSGKRVWFKKYMSVQVLYSGLAGEMPIPITTNMFTLDEYIMYCLKNEL